MKRCPECRRDYYDDSLLYCLDDGNALLEGPASASGAAEPSTAILHETAPPAEAATRVQIHTTAADKTAVVSSGAADIPKSKGFDKWLLLVPTALAILLIGGFFGYRYFALGSNQIESIAIMPFVNESGNADVEYLSDGMTETLIKSLSEVPHLSVKSRSTVFYYKGKETLPKKIGEDLNVQAVLLGRVNGRGDDLRLNLELVNTQTQDVIWTEQYDRKQSDLVNLQSEIAKDVSTKLRAKLSGADEAKVTKTSTTVPEAFQAYLRGRYYWNRRTTDNLKKAIEQFKTATDKDPNYALAYAGLADCYVLLPEYGGTPISETLPQARTFAERAIAIDDQLAEAHTSMGAVNSKSWQWADAEREFKRAIELNPNYATSYHFYCVLLRSLGRFDEAAAMIQRAHELDPLSGVISINVAQTYMIRKEYQAMAENSLKVIDLDPAYPGGYVVLGLAYLKLGRNAEAIASLQKGVELGNRASPNLAVLGYAYAVTGNRTEAIGILRELEERYAKREASGGNLSGVNAGLGDKDKAFEWVEKAFQDRSGELGGIRYAIPAETLRDDPRYKDLLKRMGLPD
jgi:TolB-like protein/Tfp pilus assembly protein PilF